MVTDQGTVVFLSLAWTYVLVRCVHTYIHTGQNKVEYRLVAYFASWLVLGSMWAYLAVGVSSV